MSRPVAPLGGMRQRELVQTREQEQGEREQRGVGHPGGRLPCVKATKLAMTVTVKAMDSQRWPAERTCSNSMGPPPDADKFVAIDR